MRILMPINLDKPLSWTTADADEAAMLDDLQGNILKSHGRDHTAQLFLHFDDSQPGRAFLRALADQVKSAAQQLHEAEIYRQTKQSAGGFVVCFLSYAGYRALNVAEHKIPDGPAFRLGMKGRAGELDDPPVDAWEPLFQQASHALVLIADDSEAQTRQRLWRLRRMARQYGVREIGVEIGKAIKNHHGRNIEHFGYVDGISVPVMLAEDLPREHLEWTPEAPLAQALVRDPGVESAFSFGSYFVFRKLEQNVRAFKEAEHQLGETLSLKNREQAGALAIGRFEDGTPVVLSSRAGLTPESPENDFSYGDDPQGRHCPLHAHIRKVNPRGESGAEDERAHLIVRRGITYGDRADDPSDEDLQAGERPSGGVGLLFMAYQSGIENGFEYMQKNWANAPNYVRDGVGPDPIIAGRKVVEWQKDARFRWPARWGAGDAPKPAPFALEQLVTLKGGEYFFAPCISFLQSLDSEE
jgi:Dyp-type peroxidase family